MFRNKELIIYICLIAAQAAFAVLCFAYYKNLSIISYVLVSLMALESIIFIIKLYREIKKLSRYLVKIQNVNDNSNMSEIYGYLTMNNYREGELSILKTEIYKVTRMLIEQKEKLKSDKVFLADSLADISHQLKTPLTSLRVMADLIEEENLPPQKRHEFVTNIHIQLNRIEWLVSTLLKMSKLDAGTIKMNISSVNVKKLINQGFNHLLIPMELKNQTLEILCDDSVMCPCDFYWMAEAIANIGKNCMEHTENGGKIKVSAEENSIYSSIVISDNGAGIDRDDLPHIFERFYKGKNSSKGSVGIGLALSKQIIILNGGIIEAESIPMKGTAFKIRIYKKVV